MGPTVTLKKTFKGLGFACKALYDPMSIYLLCCLTSHIPLLELSLWPH